MYPVSCVNVNVVHIWKALESRHVIDQNKDDFCVVMLNM